MPEITPSTLDEIVELLAPLLISQDERMTLLVRALGISPQSNTLRTKIDFKGSASDFTVMLVRYLSHYGEVEPGKQALWSVLLEVREDVGYDKQQRIDALESVVNTSTVKIPASLEAANTSELSKLIETETVLSAQSANVSAQRASMSDRDTVSSTVSINKQPTTDSTSPPPASNTNLSPILFRVGAFVIDYMVFAFILWILTYISGENPDADLSTAFYLLIFGANFVYAVFLPTAWDGKTIGKYVMGIKIVSADGKPLNEIQLTIRVAVAYLGAIVIFIGYLVAFRNEENVTWHDRAANTRVVKFR